MSPLYGLDMLLVAIAAHPHSVDTATSSVSAGTDAAAGVAIMLTGLAIFVSCLAIRRRWHQMDITSRIDGTQVPNAPSQ